MHKLLLPVLGLAWALFAGPAFPVDDKPKGDVHEHHAAAYDACAKACLGTKSEHAARQILS